MWYAYLRILLLSENALHFPKFNMSKYWLEVAVGHWTYSHFQKLEFKLTDPKARLKASSLICGSNKNIGMLCMQELFFFLGEWINWNIVSDVYIFTKGKKSISAEKNEDVELTHTQVVRCRLCVLCE